MKTILLVFLFLITSCSLFKTSAHNPCLKDVKKLCAHVIPGAGRIGDCMQEHKDEVSKECTDQYLKQKNQHEETFNPAMAACATEEQQYCSEVKKYSARRLNCVKDAYLKYPDSISEKCREAFSKIIEIVPPVFN